MNSSDSYLLFYQWIHLCLKLKTQDFQEKDLDVLRVKSLFISRFNKIINSLELNENC